MIKVRSKQITLEEFYALVDWLVENTEGDLSVGRNFYSQVARSVCEYDFRRGCLKDFGKSYLQNWVKNNTATDTVGVCFTSDTDIAAFTLRWVY